MIGQKSGYFRVFSKIFEIQEFLQFVSDFFLAPQPTFMGG
jgi:hypothetical protein